MEVAEWFINNPLLMLFCFAAVALAADEELNGKIDYIVKRVDEIHKRVTGHDVRITKLETDGIRREEREKYEEGVAELRIYRFIMSNIVKIAVSVIIALLIAWFIWQLGL
jgi:hypothetical protein